MLPFQNAGKDWNFCAFCFDTEARVMDSTGNDRIWPRCVRSDNDSGDRFRELLLLVIRSKPLGVVIVQVNVDLPHEMNTEDKQISRLVGDINPKFAPSNNRSSVVRQANCEELSTETCVRSY